MDIILQEVCGKMNIKEYYAYRAKYREVNPKHTVGKKIGMHGRFMCLFSYHIPGKNIKPYFTNGQIYAPKVKRW